MSFLRVTVFVVMSCLLAQCEHVGTRTRLATMHRSHTLSVPTDVRELNGVRLQLAHGPVTEHFTVLGRTGWSVTIHFKITNNRKEILWMDELMAKMTSRGRTSSPGSAPGLKLEGEIGRSKTLPQKGNSVQGLPPGVSAKGWISFSFDKGDLFGDPIKLTIGDFQFTL